MNREREIAGGPFLQKQTLDGGYLFKPRAVKTPLELYFSARPKIMRKKPTLST
jgi:hypothetical protein